MTPNLEAWTLLQTQLRASEEEQERAEATLSRTLDDFDEERDGILVQVHTAVGLGIGPYGGPREGGHFLMSQVPLYGYLGFTLKVAKLSRGFVASHFGGSRDQICTT